MKSSSLFMRSPVRLAMAWIGAGAVFSAGSLALAGDAIALDRESGDVGWAYASNGTDDYCTGEEAARDALKQLRDGAGGRKPRPDATIVYQSDKSCFVAAIVCADKEGKYEIVVGTGASEKEANDMAMGKARDKKKEGAEVEIDIITYQTVGADKKNQGGGAGGKAG